MVQFSPIVERGEAPNSARSATLLLRPTISHPDLSKIIGEDVQEAMHVKLIRDDDGKPVDTVHVHGYADRSMTRKIEDAIWAELDFPVPLPEVLGTIEPGNRSESLAVTQLLLLFHLFQTASDISPASARR